ncbi:MAG: hypothetical protein ABFD77_05990 [Thermotogota bacterium]
MQGKIEIENQTGRAIEYRIDHQVVCTKAGRCFCTSGRRGPVTSSIHVPGGKGQRTGGLDPRVMLIPELKADATGPRPKVKIIGAEAGKVAETRAQVSDEPIEGSKKGGGRKGKIE